jgi:hypothetical protein
VKQKKALQVTLIVFIAALIQTQLIWAGYAPFFNGYGGLIIFGGLSTITFVMLVIQFIAYQATKKK